MRIKNERAVILGVDPGYDRCGWAVLATQGKQVKLLDCNSVETNRQADKQTRFLQIWNHFQHLLQEYPITEISMESLFFSRNVSTALPVSEVRGLVFAAALQAGIPVYEYGPSQIKVAVTGDGRASKQQILKMIAVLLKLEKIPKLDDTGDALAAALTHSTLRNVTI